MSECRGCIEDTRELDRRQARIEELRDERDAAIDIVIKALVRAKALEHILRRAVLVISDSAPWRSDVLDAAHKILNDKEAP